MFVRNNRFVITHVIKCYINVSSSVRRPECARVSVSFPLLKYFPVYGLASSLWTWISPGQANRWCTGARCYNEWLLIIHPSCREATGKIDSSRLVRKVPVGRLLIPTPQIFGCSPRQNNPLGCVRSAFPPRRSESQHNGENNFSSRKWQTF